MIALSSLRWSTPQGAPGRQLTAGGYTYAPQAPARQYGTIPAQASNEHTTESEQILMRHVQASHRAMRHGKRMQSPPARQAERHRIAASLIAASRALPDDPDLSALRLDGAIRRLALALSPAGASDDPAQALRSLDREHPSLAWRLRLALQANHPAARLAHCWALLDALSAQNDAHAHNAHSSDDRR